MIKAPSRPAPRRKFEKPPPNARQLYFDWLRGKRVIVVGPAGYLSGRGLGPWIDSHDVVVKLNWGETLPAADYGSRTDVLYKRLLKLGHADDILIDEYVAAGIKWVVAVDSPHTRNQQYLEKTIGNRIQWFIDWTTRTELMREMGNSPLLGPIAIKDLLAHSSVKSITVAGCDFYLTGYGPKYGGTTYRTYMKRREGTIGPTHDGSKQLRWLVAQREKDRRLTFDDRLNEIAEMANLPDRKVTQGVVAIIPARYGSSRFPGKPLAPIAGKPMILHVCERVRQVIDNVVVATDDERIAAVVTGAGFKAIITPEALTGTDRVAWAVSKLQPAKANIYVNVQGDEPLVDPTAILALVEAKRKSKYRFASVLNAMTALQPEEAESRDVVKAVIRKGKALVYCSRSPVPTGREGHAAQWKQLGLYAFDRAALRKFADFGKRSGLEAAEDVEILRFIDMGVPVQMVEVKGSTQAVDRPDDIAKVEALLG